MTSSRAIRVVAIRRRSGRLYEGVRRQSNLVTKEIWRERFDDINAFERHRPQWFRHPQTLSAHLQERATPPLPQAPRARWWDYMRAYESMIRHTETPARDMDCRPGQQEVVCALGRRRGHHRRARRARSEIPRGDRGAAPRIEGRAIVSSLVTEPPARNVCRDLDERQRFGATIGRRCLSSIEPSLA
jgi:hypothetical protein